MAVVEGDGHTPRAHKCGRFCRSHNAQGAAARSDADFVARPDTQFSGVQRVDDGPVLGEDLESPGMAGSTRLAVHVHLVGHGRERPFPVLIGDIPARGLTGRGERQGTAVAFPCYGVARAGELLAPEQDFFDALLLLVP